MTLGSDQDGVSPVIATILLVLVVVVLSATVFVLANGYSSGIAEPAPHLALVTDPSGSTTGQWLLSFQMAMPPRDIDQFIFVLRTPQNGTLVAEPEQQPIQDVMDFYWQLGPNSGTGRHVDNQTDVGTEGYGGFHLQLVDLDIDGRLGGGDKVSIWFDGDGDQAHRSSADDPWPDGRYTFEIKHMGSERYVAYETRDL